MTYDHALEARLDELSLYWPGIGKKKMFGGMGYLLNGNLTFAIWKDHLVVRCGAAAHARCLALPGVSPFDATGRPMSGWVMVAPEVLDSDESLRAWMEQGRDFAVTLEARAE